MVMKVVRPATSSVLTSVPFSLSLKTFSNDFLPFDNSEYCNDSDPFIESLLVQKTIRREAENMNDL